MFALRSQFFRLQSYKKIEKYAELVANEEIHCGLDAFNNPGKNGYSRITIIFIFILNNASVIESIVSERNNHRHCNEYNFEFVVPFLYIHIFFSCLCIQGFYHTPHLKYKVVKAELNEIESVHVDDVEPTKHIWLIRLILFKVQSPRYQFYRKAYNVENNHNLCRFIYFHSQPYQNIESKEDINEKSSSIEEYIPIDMGYFHY